MRSPGSRVLTTLPSSADMNVPAPMATSTHHRREVSIGLSG